VPIEKLKVGRIYQAYNDSQQGRRDADRVIKNALSMRAAREIEEARMVYVSTPNDENKVPARRASALENGRGRGGRGGRGYTGHGSTPGHYERRR